MDHLKTHHDHAHNIPHHLSENQHDSPAPSFGAKMENEEKGKSLSKPKIFKGQIPKEMKIIVPLSDSSLVSDQMGLNISPISAVDQTNNNISFSMEDSSQQSQFSQSGPNKIDRNYYDSTKIDDNTGRSQIDRF